MQPLAELLLEAIAASGAGALGDFVTEDADEAAIREVLRPLSTIDDLRVGWISVNVDRVDAGLTGSGREWRLVTTAEDNTRIAEAWVHEKPRPFAGVPGGRIVVLNGPSGSGKSSVMTAMLDQGDTPWVMFDELVVGAVAEPYLIWRDASPTLVDGYLAGIAGLAGAGNQVVLSSGGVPFAEIRDAFSNVATTYVGLDCPLDVLLERERGRPGRWGGLAEASAGIHAGWNYDVRFDTTTSLPTDIAQHVLTAATRDVPQPS
ncbi:MAG: phosphotransferase-like protein [Microthrixaceae bacterium]